MLDRLRPGQPCWLRTAEGFIRCRVVESYVPRHGARWRVIVRALEDGPGFKAGRLAVARTIDLRWRNVDHRKERGRSWLSKLAR